MRFAQSYYVFGFWIVIGLGAFFIWAFKAKQKTLTAFAEAKLLPELTRDVSVKNQIVKSILFIGAAVFTILALMRPQWGFEFQEVKRTGLDILIAVDTSRSMLASDVKPNRLQRSKLAVKDLIKKLKGDRVGLIAFAGTAYLQCPLTVDYDAFLLALSDLDVTTIPRGGTSISGAIETALKSYEGGLNKYKVLIIITDGEDHEGDALKAAETAKREGLKIFCIGIGTSEGELIQVAGETGQKTFLKDKDGAIVKSRLNESLLQKIALTTDASYIRSMGAEFGLEAIYEKKLANLQKRDIKTQADKLYHERFQIPLAVALLLLIIEPLVSDRRKT